MVKIGHALKLGDPEESITVAFDREVEFITQMRAASDLVDHTTIAATRGEAVK